MEIKLKNETTLRNIVAMIAETKPDFGGSAHLRDDLRVDSVRAIEIAFEIERAFNVSVPLDRFGTVRTFDDIVRFVEELHP